MEGAVLGIRKRQFGEANQVARLAARSTTCFLHSLFFYQYVGAETVHIQCLVIFLGLLVPRYEDGDIIDLEKNPINSEPKILNTNDCHHLTIITKQAMINSEIQRRIHERK